MLVHIDAREKYPDLTIGKGPNDPGILTEVPDIIVDRFEKARAEYQAAHDQVLKFWEFARNREADAKAKPLINLTFHDALMHHKAGKDIAREAWGESARLVWRPQALPNLTAQITDADGKQQLQQWKMPPPDITAHDWKVL